MGSVLGRPARCSTRAPGRSASRPAHERMREPLVAVIRHGGDEAPERPHRFTIVDENGVEREVYALPTRRPW